MTCGEFLKALQEHPDAELVFEQIMEPKTTNGRTVRLLDDLDLWISDYEVRVTHDPFKYMN